MNLILEVAVRATVVLGLAWLATSLLRRASADVRGRIWRTALAATVLLFEAARQRDQASEKGGY